MKFFKVEAKCGHVGRNNYVIKTFAVNAESGKAAAAIVRDTPRVKHHHKDAIRSVEEIGQKEYDLIIANNRKDPYFSCENIQDQRIEVVNDMICKEERIDLCKRDESSKPIYYRKERVRHPKKFFRNYQYEVRNNIC